MVRSEPQIAADEDGQTGSQATGSQATGGKSASVTTTESDPHNGGSQSVVLKPGKHRLAVVCFLGTECPMARSYASRLSELQRQYAEQGVAVYGIFSNFQDSPKEIRQYVSNHEVAFRIAIDHGNRVADAYGATRTPEAFLLDDQLKLRYHGRIDDQYAPGVVKQQADRFDLREAIDERLAGKRVSIPKTEALGCIIGRAPEEKHEEQHEVSASNDVVTYSEHVSRVLQRRCIECHRDGEIGPFAMDSYREVVGWAETMMEVIDNGRMPPWHADPNVGHFANARAMPEEDKTVIREWIRDGLPEGDPALLPEPLEFVDGWQLQREPDLVIPMRSRPFEVPKDGVVEYQYFVADPGFEEDKWISSAQVVPGSREVVHHAIVFVRPPDGARFSGVGWLTAYVPGQRIRPLPAGRARRVPAGSKLVFQMHYTPIGRKVEDVTEVGLIFADPNEVTHEVFTTMAIDQQFEIPPRASEHRVSAELKRMPTQGELLAITPHMHYRGDSFKLFASRHSAAKQLDDTAKQLDDTDIGNPEAGEDPGDRQELLLHVPEYDFNWQHTYLLEEPLPLDLYESLRFEATFNNSSSNPFNPDPDRWVTWGDQTWEEMAVAFFEVSKPLEREDAKVTELTSTSAKVQSDQRRQEKIDAYVERVFDKLDRDGDGVIQRAETEIVVRRIFFHRWDLDGDGRVTRAEVEQIAGDIIGN